MKKPQRNRGLGCGGIALTLLIVAVIILIVGAAIGFWVVTSRLLPYTSENPVKVTPVQVSEADYNAARSRWETAREARAGSTFRLTANDLNMLLAQAPEWQAAREHVRVAIRDSRVGLDGSFPMPNLPRVKGRYLNGTVWFVPGVMNGRFVADIQQITASGTVMPEDTEKKFDTGFEEALRSFLTTDRMLGPLLIRVKAIEMEPDAVVLKF